MSVNMPARTKDKVHGAKETVQAKTEQVKQQAQAKTEEAKKYAREGAEALHAKAGDVALQAENLAHQAVEALPSPVATRVETVLATARQRPLPTAAVAVLVLFALRLLLRRVFRKNR